MQNPRNTRCKFPFGCKSATSIRSAAWRRHQAPREDSGICASADATIDGQRGNSGAANFLFGLPSCPIFRPWGQKHFWNSPALLSGVASSHAGRTWCAVLWCKPGWCSAQRAECGAVWPPAAGIRFPIVQGERKGSGHRDRATQKDTHNMCDCGKSGRMGPKVAQIAYILNADRDPLPSMLALGPARLGAM